MISPFILLQVNGSDQADTWCQSGVVAQIEGRLPQAQQHYNKAIFADPRHVQSIHNLAAVFAQSNLLNEALLTIERAAMFDDNKHGLIYTNWAIMTFDADRVDEAIAHAKKGVEISKDNHSKLILALISASAGIPHQSLELYNQILDTEPMHPTATINSCFVQTLTDMSPKELLAQRKRWYEANKLQTPRKLNFANDRTPDRRLRIGYVGGDFKCHSAAMIFGPMILQHTKDNFEVFIYSSLPVDPDKDISTKKFKDAVAPNWRDIEKLNDDQTEELIRNDKIDILVDLASHTGGGRLSVFVRKPAPIQVTGWGFAHGTGLPEIDYFFADPVAVQESERQFFSEKIHDLPCVVTYNPTLEYELKTTSHLPYFKNDYITFGSYARYEKMSSKCLQTYAEILKQVPNSKIQFKDNAYRRPYSIRRVLAEMPGIATDRLLFSVATSHQEHMLAYQQADLLLDPFPHSGGVVCLEQLYMGVPIVTLYGTQPSGRTTSSVLTAMGRTDWIAKTPDEYIKKAVALVSDPASLQRVRKTLHDEFMSSPVMVGYKDKVEKAYRKMWLDYLAK